MWEIIYGCSGRGIALRSSIGQYRRAARFAGFPKEQYDFGEVKYHVDLASCPELQPDLQNGPIPIGLGIAEKIARIGFHKRACFEGEREWRAVFVDTRPHRGGCLIGFDLDELITSVVIGPRAEPFVQYPGQKTEHARRAEQRPKSCESKVVFGIGPSGFDPLSNHQTNQSVQYANNRGEFI